MPHYSAVFFPERECKPRAWLNRQQAMIKFNQPVIITFFRTFKSSKYVQLTRVKNYIQFLFTTIYKRENYIQTKKLKTLNV